MHEKASVEQGKGIEGDLPLFVGRYHQYAHVAIGVDGTCDAAHAAGVGLGVELEPEQAQVVERPAADQRRVFACLLYTSRCV